MPCIELQFLITLLNFSTIYALSIKRAVIYYIPFNVSSRSHILTKRLLREVIQMI